MPLTLNNTTQLQIIIKLRFAVVAIQILLILFVNIVLAYDLPVAPLFIIIIAELLFTALSYFYYKNHVNKLQSVSNTTAIFIQIFADLLFLSIILYYSGGATNAFVSLLLIPIAIAAVTLTTKLLLVIALLAIIFYSILLWQLPMSVMHGNMEGHFIAMWINFIFSTGVVALVVGRMARNLNKQQLALSAYRENLLKQEQVVSLGVASAQITHQIATPISTIQLLTDELAEEIPNHEIINDMQTELLRCKESLATFRKFSFDIKEQTLLPTICNDVLLQISDNITLNYPDVILESTIQSSVSNNTVILADTSLLPAILNLINNAIRASKLNSSNLVQLSSSIENNMWQLVIKDNGTGFSLEKLAELGIKPIESKQGLGMAVFLSYATLERLGGKLSLTNHKNGGALVTLTLPLTNQ